MRTDEVAKGDVVVGDDALDLVELGQVGGVDGLVPEDAVDGEQLAGLEAAGLLGGLVEHGGGDGGGVGAEDELGGLGLLPVVPVAERAVGLALALVHGANPFGVVPWERVGRRRVYAST
jgi:hypothetical protein